VDKVQERVLSTLLNEMDGVSETRDVLIIGATNRPDLLDAALMRPGRFDKRLYVAPPDETARYAILRLYAARSPLAADVEPTLRSLARRCRNYSGADLAALCREAAMIALRDTTDGSRRPHVQHIAAKHFTAALASCAASLTPDQLEQYSNFLPK
jgi:transitional endoplasmic reticulum ATPase